MGAWIETRTRRGEYTLTLSSHPTWVRGLKPFLVDQAKETLKSHPTWVRGLKQALCPLALLAKAVAPYVGAWIETSGLSGEQRES